MGFWLGVPRFHSIRFYDLEQREPSLLKDWLDFDTIKRVESQADWMFPLIGSHLNRPEYQFYKVDDRLFKTQPEGPGNRWHASEWEVVDGMLRSTHYLTSVFGDLWNEGRKRDLESLTPKEFEEFSAKQEAIREFQRTQAAVVSMPKLVDFRNELELYMTKFTEGKFTDQDLRNLNTKFNEFQAAIKPWRPFFKKS